MMHVTFDALQRPKCYSNHTTAQKNQPFVIVSQQGATYLTK